MRVPITYIASSGNTYNLISDGIKHKEANYWEWAYKAEGTQLQYGFRIADFSKDAKTYKTTLMFYGPEVRRRALLSALHDDFENDIRRKKPGKLIWGSYYIMCYILESSTVPTNALTQTNNEISIFCPHPFWMQNFNIEFPKQEESENTSGFLDFTYDFDYDYTPPAFGRRIISRPFPLQSDFRMTIFGEAVNPRVHINGYIYALNMTIQAGAYVIIDSRDKTIVLYNTDGTQTNAFDYRDKTQSIFEQIPGGDLVVTWDPSYGVNLTIYQERSEPRIEVG